VAFVQRETLLTEPVEAPERDRKGKRGRGKRVSGKKKANI